MKYFILILFFVLQLVGFSQQKKYSLPVISATKSNVVFRGIPNPISIALPGFFSKDIVVKVNIGKLVKEERENDYTYFFKDTIQENQVTFSVFIKQKNKRIKLVGSWDFRLKEIPKPIICLGSNCTNGFLYENLQKASTLFATFQLNQTSCGLDFRVKEFKVKHIKTNGDSMVFECTNQILNKEIKESFKNAEDGDTISIYDIIILGPSRIEKSEHELLFVLKKS
jgi:hypothetical protein